MNATLPASPEQQLNTSEFLRRVNALRTIDNITNGFYIAREYLVLGLVIGLSIFFYQNREEWGLAWVWNVPVTFLAVVIIGACQHRLSNFAHEASHYMLFRNRVLNEVVSDWFSMYPMFSSTHHYRVQHLAHHQFVNDPEKDPDIAQMEASGHRFEFPMEPGRFVWRCVVKQALWLPSLIRYIRIRARYAVQGTGHGPYRSKGPAKRPMILVGAAYLGLQVLTLTGLAILGNSWLLAIIPAVLWAGVLVIFALAPDRLYAKSIIKPDVHLRWLSCLRVSYLTLMFGTIAWLTYLTGQPWPLYYLLLWALPLLTTFSFFMIMRQVVQHGNASQDRLTNTRVFHVHRLIQLAVFPWGMDYHLPHHLFPMVPHYRLKELHTLLMENEAYRQQATEVDGYFFHHERPPVNPTVLELMARDNQTI